jgi:hypothetical protein
MLAGAAAGVVLVLHVGMPIALGAMFAGAAGAAAPLLGYRTHVRRLLGQVGGEQVDGASGPWLRRRNRVGQPVAQHVDEDGVDVVEHPRFPVEHARARSLEPAPRGAGELDRDDRVLHPVADRYRVALAAGQCQVEPVDGRDEPAQLEVARRRRPPRAGIPARRP